MERPRIPKERPAQGHEPQHGTGGDPSVPGAKREVGEGEDRAHVVVVPGERKGQETEEEQEAPARGGVVTKEPRQQPGQPDQDRGEGEEEHAGDGPPREPGDHAEPVHEPTERDRWVEGKGLGHPADEGGPGSHPREGHRSQDQDQPEPQGAREGGPSSSEEKVEKENHRGQLDADGQGQEEPGAGGSVAALQVESSHHQRRQEKIDLSQPDGGDQRPQHRVGGDEEEKPGTRVVGGTDQPPHERSVHEREHHPESHHRRVRAARSEGEERHPELGQDRRVDVGKDEPQLIGRALLEIGGVVGVRSGGQRLRREVVGVRINGGVGGEGTKHHLRDHQGQHQGQERHHHRGSTSQGIEADEEGVQGSSLPGTIQSSAWRGARNRAPSSPPTTTSSSRLTAVRWFPSTRTALGPSVNTIPSVRGRWTRFP